MDEYTVIVFIKHCSSSVGWESYLYRKVRSKNQTRFLFGMITNWNPILKTKKMLQQSTGTITSLYIQWSFERLVQFYGVSTLVGHLMPNPIYIYIYIKYTISKHIWSITFLNKPEFIFFAHTQFLPGSGHIDTAKWMHYLDAN